ncbi:MAG TPA: tyrosine-type recombinase/integrase [Candidatus Margulisiibacteriota bacterium]|nr:tyrosine-type recombinase/integrase [Candidatus Margulisiibacteriota bacterium]
MKSTWEGFRSAAAEGIECYLAHKRALGRCFRNEEMGLRMLDRFLVEREVSTIDAITAEQLETFVSSRRRPRPRSYNHLLGVVRRLFDWLVAQGRLMRSPVATRPRRDTAARIPFLFNVVQARSLLEVASRLPDRSNAPQRGATYRTIFALLYGLGLRVGEVSRLCVRDVDLDRQLLVIRQSKFSKNRLVPFGPRMRDELVHQLHLQTVRRGTLSPDSPFFTFRRGQPLNPGTISQTFHQLWPRLGLTLAPGVAPPRAHDLRHAFAVGTLLRWYREGIDPSSRLLHLSTFMGHVQPESTAVYLTITAELLQEGSRRFEQFAAPALAGVCQ